jgi:hypothetical protein
MPASASADRGENGAKYRGGRQTPKSASQDADFVGEFKPENRSPKSNLHFERVNAATYKLVDGEMVRVPAVLGFWAGYNSTKATAWLINIGINSPAWVARCGDRACGPSSFNQAKSDVLAMAQDAAGEQKIGDPLEFLHQVQAALLDQEVVP